MLDPAEEQCWGPNTRLAAYINDAGRISTELSESPVFGVLAAGGY